MKDKNINYIYVEDLNLYNKIKNDSRAILLLPRVIQNYEVENIPLMLGEFGGLNKYQNVHTDVYFNVTNSYTVAFLHSLGANKITLSYELDFNQIKDIIEAYESRYKKHPNLEVIVFGREEVMINKYNLLKHYNIKSNNVFLEDRFKNRYRICEINGMMRIFNYRARNLLDYNFYRIGINNIRYNFLDNDELNIL